MCVVYALLYKKNAQFIFHTEINNFCNYVTIL